MVKKFILFVFFSFLVFASCDLAMEGLDVKSGTKYIITSKKKITGDCHYTYRLIKVGDKWYDYDYTDTTDFNVGDTLILKIEKTSNNYGNK